MNIHASPASAKPIQQFKVGDFVRIQNGETVGRVLEDTDANGSTAVKVFDDDSFGDNPKFGPGILSMWTPTAAPILTASSSAPRVIEHPIDIELAFELLMKISGGTHLIGSLAAQSDLIHSNDLEFIHSTIDPLVGKLLEMVFAEQSRQEAESDSDED
jgi:hypothetical protein